MRHDPSLYQIGDVANDLLRGMDMKKMLLGSVLMAISTMALAGTASDGISSIVATNNEAGIAVTGNLGRLKNEAEHRRSKWTGGGRW
ncbi:hypothetical protein, partial [Acidithiobacillus caldus]|uniref:hypothetical protein n=1 Tax=Acidithiobacillus caldus TaxID=33059 RepID=UPI0013014ABC